MRYFLRKKVILTHNYIFVFNVVSWPKTKSSNKETHLKIIYLPPSFEKQLETPYMKE